MTIVTTRYRYKRPLRKRAKAVAIEGHSPRSGWRLSTESRCSLSSLTTAGAIYTAARILALLCDRACFPEMTHTQQHKHLARGEISVAAFAARERGEPVQTEHVMPQRAFAVEVCKLIEGGASDRKVIANIRANFRLVTLTPEERRKVDRLNRIHITKDRIAEAGIKLMKGRP